MNHFVGLGRLTREPEVNYTQNGKVYCKFTVAIDRPFRKDQPKEADFIPCVAWGKTAETIGNYLTKGSKILLEGRINTGSYTAKDGTKKYTTDVLLDRFEFVDSRNGGSAGGNNAAQGGFTQQASDGNGGKSMSSFGYAIDPEEIPF